MPDKGSWTYDYNGFGELTEQEDAKGQTSTMTYDGLGRMITRIDRKADSSIESNTAWHYDTAANGLGQLDYVEDSVSGYIKAVEYDSLGRPSETVTSLGVGGSEGDHYEKVTYDQYGRTYQVFDASRDSATYTDNGVEHRYNAYGYLEELVDAVHVSGQTRAVYRTIQALDARGNVTLESLGNNVTTSRLFDDDTGRITDLLSTHMVNGDIQELSYDWDTLGNLTDRTDQSGSKNLTETFTYDGLNRLTAHAVAGQSAKSLTYDALGNIKSKTGVGSYSYGGGGAGPHALTSAGGVSYSYDANGNSISGDGRSITYTTFDKASSISKGGHATQFSYGPDRARYKRVDIDGSDIKTTLYIGSVEKITKPDGSREVKRHIGGVLIETEAYSSGGSLTGEEKHYIFKDHLGSTDVITDMAGTITDEFSFDPWGQRRSGVNWNDRIPGTVYLIRGIGCII